MMLKIGWRSLKNASIRQISITKNSKKVLKPGLNRTKKIKALFIKNFFSFIKQVSEKSNFTLDFRIVLGRL